MSKKKKSIYFVAGISIAFFGASYAKLTGSLSPEAIAERMAPEGQVAVEGAVAVETAVSEASGPEKIYKSNCAMCHDIGLAGAPKKGNKSDWAPRHAKGIENMVSKAITGYKAMPPKGNCLKCSEDDIRKTIEFMIQGLF